LAKLEEENNPMKVLENHIIDLKQEMAILDALQDIQAKNAWNERVGNSIDLFCSGSHGGRQGEIEEKRNWKRMKSL
jgi:histidinol phosphatase-like enzyme